MIEKVIINTENSRKFLSTNWLRCWGFCINNFMNLELPNKRIKSFKREKPLKGIKGERKN